MPIVLPSTPPLARPHRLPALPRLLPPPSLLPGLSSRSTLLPSPLIRSPDLALPAGCAKQRLNCAIAAAPAATSDPIRIMKVAVVGGTGNVGSRLARQLCLSGADVILASRNPEDEKALAAVAKVKEGASGSSSAATFADAAASADAIIIATPGYPTAELWKPVVEPFAEYEGVVLDASNPLTAYPELNLSVDQNTTSAAEEIQKLLPKAKVFKAFNSLGAEIMSNPVIGGKKVTMMYAGPSEDAAAKDTTEKVIAAAGFEPVLVGPIRAARNLESIAELWIHMAVSYGLGSRDGFAFTIQK